MTGGPVWADLRCPACGGQTYGPVGNTTCQAGHAEVSMRPYAGDDVDWCGHDAPPLAASKGVRPCCAATGHRGGHVWWQEVVLADGRFSALWFYEENGKPLMTLDMRGSGTSPEDAAALYQAMTCASQMRAARRAEHEAREREIRGDRRTHTDADPE